MSESSTSSASTQKLTVDLGDRSYPIWITGDASHQLASDLRVRKGATASLIDEALLGSLPEIEQAGFVIPQHPKGETAKSLTMLGAIYDSLAEQKVARDGCLVAIGGGVTGDLGGFAAASYLRGIDFYQVPTTLLAMVDSSVGGKTGINIAAGKNLVGAFWQPKAVYISTSILSTLPAWEFSAGMAEVIKYGMLYDRALFDQLNALEQPLTWDHPALPGIIHRCCAIKAEIVKADEKETAASGGRALLNLGHTFAHAIENVAGYGAYLHGEAVAIGLVLAARLSEKLDGFDIDAADVSAVSAMISRYHLPTDLRTPLKRRSRVADYQWHQRDSQPATAEDCPADIEPQALPVDRLLDAMKRDKKVKAGKLRFVAMETLGQAVTVNEVDESLVRELWLEAGATS
ncbi:3-dehydroquinate synthase [Cerasicoccus fimbriatus]|uniref:3-dehydroquinate synthase n=1 Tax=Cerasicoccus fimbriatus TaxID=3014554 RepID=UPI0022B32172|nr:3-dehydroquinate synthase [Cerasicoccus sp. TK19100]